VPGGENRGHGPGGLQTVYSGDDAIGKAARRRHIGQSLQLGGYRNEVFVEIVLDHGFLT